MLGVVVLTPLPARGDLKEVDTQKTKAIRSISTPFSVKDGLKSGKMRLCTIILFYVSKAFLARDGLKENSEN
ncbi:hypothetical protein [Nostoc sp. CALU 1950]|uniref:hypothetical protein n=1 Tax=Nostoc sp. CALU 1950 TaxID=3104321 RepID=UPI003EBB1505